jgi:hypothetical protein
VACVRDDEVELVGAGEVADAGVADAGGLVRRDDVVPGAHLRRAPAPPPEGCGRGAVAERSFSL